MLKLDFTIQTPQDRKDYVTKLLKENKNKYTQKEIETMGDYILYGKDSDTGTNMVDRKEIEINTRYGSYKKKKPESLEALMDNPNFNEGIFIHYNNHYKKVKPTIDREKDSDIPGIQELWKEIDRIKYKIDVSTGKIEDPSIEPYTGTALYKIKHILIELRTQQYYLKDSVKPTILQFGNTARQTLPYEENEIPWGEGNYDIAPLGLFASSPKRFLNPRELEEKDYTYNQAAKYLINFCDPDHIAILCENYNDIKDTYSNKINNTTIDLLDTLDFYTKAANLSEEKQIILKCKKNKLKNKEIQKILKTKFNSTHTANYISTIWKQNICKEIADAAELNYTYYLNRENPFAWKKCSYCGQIKLKDTREFVRKARSSDGLSSRCKECDKEIRRLKTEKR